MHCERINPRIPVLPSNRGVVDASIVSPHSHKMVTRHPEGGGAPSDGPSEVSARYRVEARGTSLAYQAVVLVETIYQYRTLIGKCELGIGLDWDEIDTVTNLEERFAPTADDRRMKTGRRFRREQIAVSAILRGDRLNDRVIITEIGPGGLVCERTPYVARGEEVEIVVELEDHSYRFGTRGVWLRDDGDDYRLGLAFVGMPVRLTRTQVSAHQHDMIDRIAAAA